MSSATAFPSLSLAGKTKKLSLKGRISALLNRTATVQPPIVMPTPANVIVFGRSLCSCCHQSTPEDMLIECKKCAFKMCPHCDSTCRCDDMPALSVLLSHAEVALEKSRLIERGQLFERLEDSSFYMNIKDEAGRFVYANPTVEFLTGKCWQELKGKTADRVFSDESFSDQVVLMDTHVMRTGRSYENFQRFTQLGREHVMLVKKAIMHCNELPFVVSCGVEVTGELHCAKTA